jgi:hypothetical protein
MLYIYNCYGGTHSSSLASAIHLGDLPADRIPEREEILNTAYFNKLSAKDMGRIIYRGTDNEGNKVFSFGRGTSKVLLPCLENMIKLLASEYGLREKIILSNMSPTVPPAMTMGGMLSRWLGIHFLGVPLLVAGARQTYAHILEAVRFTKESAKKMDVSVLVLNNEDKSWRLPLKH